LSESDDALPRAAFWSTAGWVAAQVARALSASLREHDLKPIRNLAFSLRACLSTPARAALRDCFDAGRYSLSYPDVAAARLSPLAHYLLAGATENRIPSPLFDPAFYRAAYEDVRVSGMSPLLHYALYGRAEGRHTNLGEANHTGVVKRENELWPEGTPLVSVVIVSFNYGRYLAEALDSVLTQTFHNLEVIVVEGGSPDPASVETTRRIARTAPPNVRFLYCDSPHRAGENRNFGIAAARGRYIVCLDADDRIAPIYLEAAVFLAEACGYDIVYPSAQFFGAAQGIWQVSEATFAGVLERNQVSTVALFRRAAWEAVGGYRDYPADLPHVPEDWDFWVRLLARGCRARSIPAALFHYRVHEGSLSAPLREGSPAQQEAIRSANRELALNPTAPPEGVVPLHPFLNLRPKSQESAPTALLLLDRASAGVWADLALALRRASCAVTAISFGAGAELPADAAPLADFSLPALFTGRSLWEDFVRYWTCLHRPSLVIDFGVLPKRPALAAAFDSRTALVRCVFQEDQIAPGRHPAGPRVLTLAASPSLRDSILAACGAEPESVLLIPRPGDQAGFDTLAASLHGRSGTGLLRNSS
jgi:hypothetical protein